MAPLWLRCDGEVFQIKKGSGVVGFVRYHINISRWLDSHYVITSGRFTNYISNRHVVSSLRTYTITRPPIDKKLTSVYYLVDVERWSSWTKGKLKSSNLNWDLSRQLFNRNLPWFYEFFPSVPSPSVLCKKRLPCYQRKTSVVVRDVHPYWVPTTVWEDNV